MTVTLDPAIAKMTFTSDRDHSSDKFRDAYTLPAQNLPRSSKVSQSLKEPE